MKKYFLFVAFCITLGFVAVAADLPDQITRFAVIDTARVYDAYYKDSTPIRNYEAKKAQFQAEIDKQVEAIRQLQIKLNEYKQKNDQANVLKTEAQISEKTAILTEYTKAKNIELENLKNSLKSSDQFYQSLYDALERIAEEGGYTMVLSLQDSSSILWYSPSVDITNDVIRRLGL